MGLKKIPKKTKLLGYTIVIEEVSQEAMDQMYDQPERSGNEGLWVCNTHDEIFRIYLTKELSLETKWSVLWHEMGHAWLDISTHDVETRCMK